jgi:hypothetical protein
VAKGLGDSLAATGAGAGPGFGLGFAELGVAGLVVGDECLVPELISTPPMTHMVKTDATTSLITDAFVNIELRTGVPSSFSASSSEPERCIKLVTEAPFSYRAEKVCAWN